KEYFALGGVLVMEEDEGAIRLAYEQFCANWGIGYPLHSVDIRHRRGDFAWLIDDTSQERRFLAGLSRLITRASLLCLACVIDRPGYDARYRPVYGRNQWHLCQTAFYIVVERAAKHAASMGRKLKVFP